MSPVFRPARCPAVLALTALCGTLTGCLGGTYNPSYFPFYLPPGDVVQTHAKPPGAGYFGNFDPKAVRLEVSPGQSANKPGAQQVLIATVYDQDGRPRRSRRVEWILDGPGYLVEADESGYLPGRGYLMDNKRAVTYTDYFEHKLCASSPRGEFTVGPGQTWCVVSSASPGETTVTAYAPEIYDKDRNTVTVRVTWGDAQFKFPAPVVSKAGGEADLVTTLHRVDGKDSPDGLKVRYRVLDSGAPAVLVGRGGAGGSVSASGGQREAEVAADDGGAAAVRVLQPAAQGGTTRVAVEVVKPDPAGLGPGTVVGKQETTVEWAAAQLSFDVVGPKAAAVGRDADFTLVVANAGKAASPAVTAHATLPENATFVRADPAPSGPPANGVLSWPLGAVAAGAKQSITVTVRPARTGEVALAAVAESADGTRAEHRATAAVDTARLKLSLEVPDVVAPGEQVLAKLVVTNPSGAAAEHVTGWVALDPGLAAASGTSPVEVPVGTVAPGETKRVAVPLTAKTAGRAFLKANVTGDGGLADRAEVGVDVRKVGLAVAVAGPAKVRTNDEATYEVRVTNSGDAALTDLVATAELPRALTVKSASDGGSVAGMNGAEWRLADLRAGETKVLKVTAAGDQSTDRAVVTATVAAGKLRAKADTAVAVAGQPALQVEVSDPPTGLTAGQKTMVRVTVRNRGTGPAKRVEVRVTGSDELKPAGGTGADRKAATIDGPKVTFGTLDSLAGGKAAVFVAEFEATKAGAARIQIEVRSDDLTQPLSEEQAVRIAGGS